jgi:high-affinity nickel-transport protein
VGWAAAYLLIFGLGTVAGMMVVTAAMAWPLAYGTRRFSRLPQALRVASGVVSLVFGLVLAYRIGMVDGLFSATPRWTPR